MLCAGKPAPEVWDLCRLQSVQAAQGFLRQEQQKADGQGMAGDVALALQEAVTCSSLARQTPLHAAAETGNAVMVKVCACTMYLIYIDGLSLSDAWTGNVCCAAVPEADGCM